MLSALARLLGASAAGWIKSAAWPVAIVALATMLYHYKQAREEADQLRITMAEKRGRDQCISAVELETARAEANLARQRAQAAIAETQEAQRISVEVQTNAESLSQELAAVRSTIAGADADRCLSPGVLELVRSGAGSGGQKSGQAVVGGAGKGTGLGQAAGAAKSP